MCCTSCLQDQLAGLQAAFAASKAAATAELQQKTSELDIMKNKLLAERTTNRRQMEMSAEVSLQRMLQLMCLTVRAAGSSAAGPETRDMWHMPRAHAGVRCMRLSTDPGERDPAHLCCVPRTVSTGGALCHVALQKMDESMAQARKVGAPAQLVPGLRTTVGSVTWHSKSCG